MVNLVNDATELDREHCRRVAEPFVNRKSVQLLLDNDVSVHPEVMAYLLAFCQEERLNEDTIFRLHFGLTECLINAVTHGNLEMSSEEIKAEGDFNRWEAEISSRARMDRYKDRKVRVLLEVEPGSSAVLTIEDEGQGFNYGKILESEPDDLYQSFGRGLVMLKKVADELKFNASGNRITMTFTHRED